MGAKKKIFRPDKLPMDIGRFFLMAFIPIYRIKKIFLGDEREVRQLKDGAVLASNHTGFSEPMVLETAFWYRRVHYVVGEIAMKGKLRRIFMEAAGCIMIDRSFADFKAIKQCVSVLRDGGYLEIFPHGGISDDNARFKDGVMLIAQQADVPVVPMYIIHRKHWWQRYRIVIGKPYYWKEHCDKKMPGIKDISRMTAELEAEYRRCKAFADKIKGNKGGY